MATGVVVGRVDLSLSPFLTVSSSGRTGKRDPLCLVRKCVSVSIYALNWGGRYVCEIFIWYRMRSRDVSNSWREISGTIMLPFVPYIGNWDDPVMKVSPNGFLNCSAVYECDPGNKSLCLKMFCWWPMGQWIFIAFPIYPFLIEHICIRLIIIGTWVLSYFVGNKGGSKKHQAHTRNELKI